MWREFILKLDPSATYFPGVAETQLITLEMAVGVVIPTELRQLLTESNGVFGEYGLRLIWPVEEILQRNVEMRTHSLYRETYMSFDHMLFFADAGNGDQFAFRVIQESVKGSDVYAWNHEDDSRLWVAPSLRLYIEWWLTGKIKI